MRESYCFGNVTSALPVHSFHCHTHQYCIQNSACHVHTSNTQWVHWHWFLVIAPFYTATSSPTQSRLQSPTPVILHLPLSTPPLPLSAQSLLPSQIPNPTSSPSGGSSNEAVIGGVLGGGGAFILVIVIGLISLCIIMKMKNRRKCLSSCLDTFHHCVFVYMYVCVCL